MHGGSHRDVFQLQRVARADVRLGARDDLVADVQILGGDDISFIAVKVVNERDPRVPVRIVLDRGNLPGNVELVPLEVDDSVESLRAAASVAHGDSAAIVPAALLVKRLEKRALRILFGKIVVLLNGHEPAAWSIGVELLDRHWFPFSFPLNARAFEEVDTLSRSEADYRFFP